SSLAVCWPVARAQTSLASDDALMQTRFLRLRGRLHVLGWPMLALKRSLLLDNRTAESMLLGLSNGVCGGGGVHRPEHVEICVAPAVEFIVQDQVRLEVQGLRVALHRCAPSL